MKKRGWGLRKWKGRGSVTAMCRERECRWDGGGLLEISTGLGNERGGEELGGRVRE